MLIVSHPTGSNFVRALLQSLEQEGLLETFYTTVAVQSSDWPLKLLPKRIRHQVSRRAYTLSPRSIVRFPFREATRLLSMKFRLAPLIKHETGWASVDAVYRSLDRKVAKSLSARGSAKQITGVYCYEDGALNTFHAAKKLGLQCFYELPIAYWQMTTKLLREEAERWPEWEPTLGGTRDSFKKQHRKTAELNLADVVIVPSQFVYDSLPPEVRRTKVCCIAEFGSPILPIAEISPAIGPQQPLRVLFAGSLTQRKGLADLFAAMQLVNRADIELIVMGSLVSSMEFYRTQYSHFHYEGPRPHADVLNLMRSCDIFVLPSIAEGRALVQQEAMACGLPLIVTANAVGQDLIEEGQTGFLVPIRSPESIAEKINWFADNRNLLPDMRLNAIEKASRYTWERYGSQIVDTVRAHSGASLNV